MTIVSTEGLEAELPMQEDDRIACRQEILSTGGTTRARGEVVDEANSLLLERNYPGGLASLLNRLWRDNMLGVVYLLYRQT